MNKEEIISMVLNASNTQLADIENALTRKGESGTTQDRKLLNNRQAAKILGVSTTTVWRLAKEGKLKTVETRLGRKRIMSQSVTDFVSGVKSTQPNP